MLAGQAILVVAALAVAVSALAPPATPGAAGPPPDARDAGDSVRALVTSNVRERPDPAATVVAVIPAGRALDVVGRAPDGTWLLVGYPPASDTRGWVPADRLGLDATALEALAAVATPAPPAGRGDTVVAALPDLVVSSVYLLQDGRMALDIRNDGEGALVDAKIPVLITRASGETVGVLEAGPTTLAPGGIATVLTPVVVTTTGTYTLQIDRQESIAEAQETNNSITRLLVAGGG